tara:strand:- start:2734 stop:3261 length:528 start_codon:yes stop_codon:yes gene_type:complete
VIDKLISFVHSLSRLCGTVAAGLLASACIIVCYMVFVRYGLGHSTIWEYEFVIFAVVSATLIGSPYVLLTRGHVNVDLIPHFLDPRPKKFLALFSSSMACIVCIILSWASWFYFYEAWINDWRTPSIWAPPLWIPIFSLGLGFSVLTLQYLVDIISIFTNRIEPFEKPLTPENIL